MLKSTIQLFIKAFLIGVLVNITLQSVADVPLRADEISPVSHTYQSMEHTSTEPAP